MPVNLIYLIVHRVYTHLPYLDSRTASLATRRQASLKGAEPALAPASTAGTPDKLLATHLASAKHTIYTGSFGIHTMCQ